MSRKPQKSKIENSTSKRLLFKARAWFYRKDLTRLAELFGTDKTGSHHYTPHYMTHFKKFRRKSINLLEIGVGGYAKPNEGGHSLRMWKAYFRKGNIFSIDIYDKSSLQEKRIQIFKGSQVDRDFLNNVADRMGTIDIIVDDGSHINEHVLQSFQILFPRLKEGGIYVIEDTQTSYWKDFGGDSENLNNPKSMMTFFKSLVDGLNYKEYVMPGYKPTYFDQHIVSMHFYHNLVFIYKGKNDEESNIVFNNYRDTSNMKE
jgi:demethylmacrocin O-methyltransferase